jgi:hypothetical protein
MDKALRIGFKTMPLDEEIKDRQSKSEAGLERSPGAVGHFLEMTGSVTNWYSFMLYVYPKFKAIDEQPDDEIVHVGGF